MNALASCPKAQPGGSANPLTSLAALPLDLSVAGRADTTEDVGEVDILINNAGIALFGPTAEFDVSAFDKMFASNVRAPFVLVAARDSSMIGLLPAGTAHAVGDTAEPGSGDPAPAADLSRGGAPTEGCADGAFGVNVGDRLSWRSSFLSRPQES